MFGVMQYWAKFLAANEGDELSSIIVQKMNWSPPLPGLYKVNVDVATFKDIRSTGIGIVICDILGQVAAVLCRKLEALLSPFSVHLKLNQRHLKQEFCLP